MYTTCLVSKKNENALQWSHSHVYRICGIDIIHTNVYIVMPLQIGEQYLYRGTIFWTLKPMQSWKSSAFEAQSLYCHSNALCAF